MEGEGTHAEKKRKREKDKNPKGKKGKPKNLLPQSRDCPPTDQCNFWMVRRARFCHLEPLADSKFCLAHSPTHEKLICPYCKNPIVNQRNMKRHLPKCPKKKREDTLLEQPYYAAGINLRAKSLSLDTTGDASSAAATAKKLLANIPFEDLKAFVDKITALHSRLCAAPLPTEMLRHPGCETFFESRIYKVKHLTQETSIIAHLRRIGLLESDCIYIDFGAGKGTLSHLLQSCSGGANILVDRQNVKRKAESQVRKLGHLCKRLAIDIVDLNLDGVQELHEGKRIVAVGKHLCGGASDLAIRCATTTLKGADMEGLAIALCCHHRCTWDTYINTEFMSELGITEKEFEMMRFMSSWAVCAFPQLAAPSAEKATEKESTQETDPPQSTENANDGNQLSPEQKLIAGRQCKELLDYGRTLALQKLGYTTRLVHYVEPSVSLENTLLLATKHSQGTSNSD